MYAVIMLLITSILHYHTLLLSLIFPFPLPFCFPFTLQATPFGFWILVFSFLVIKNSEMFIRIYYFPMFICDFNNQCSVHRVQLMCNETMFTLIITNIPIWDRSGWSLLSNTFLQPNHNAHHWYSWLHFYGRILGNSSFLL